MVDTDLVKYQGSTNQVEWLGHGLISPGWLILTMVRSLSTLESGVNLFVASATGGQVCDMHPKAAEAGLVTWDSGVPV